MGDDVRPARERARPSKQSVGVVLVTATDRRLRQTLTCERGAGEAPFPVVGLRRTLQVILRLNEMAGQKFRLSQHEDRQRRSGRRTRLLCDAHHLTRELGRCVVALRAIEEVLREA